jgi:hypothetical protein
MSLTEKRAAVIERHRNQEQFDPHWKGVAEEAKKPGSPAKLSERPVAFVCDDEIVITGGCVGKVLSAVSKFLEIAADKSFHERAKGESDLAYALAKCKQLTASPAPAELRLSQQRWNAVTYALSVVGVDCVLTDGND